MRKPALLALADGSLFRGESIGADGQTVGEVVFNTSITGYQEILTDPSYYRQIVTLTYPHIGNVGTNPADRESERVFAQGLVVRACSPVASNWRSRQSLEDYLLERGVVGISDIDTRRLTRLLREKGAQNGCLMAGDHLDPQEALAQARAFPGLKGMGLAGEVSTPEPYTWREGSWRLEDNGFVTPLELPLHVVAYDFGVKYSSLRKLVDRGCRVTVVPATTPADQVLAMDPDGVYLSNGPGDPQPCDYAIQAIQTILTTDLPVFGICLGHQLLGLASGAATVKMKFGHHGGNHPVQDLDSGRVMISSQNHGFAVDEATLPADLRPTHRSLFDGTLQGVARRDRVAFGFQGHPEAGPGPNDLDGLFDRFVAAIAERKRRVA
ncbi:MAG: glutamine-hydrolyzing carbamoyl-phosphate synthase small subunit [Candidatus Competibacteraceae bacterium]|nr:glutamine-hydrolyzing carbamoyl-phosphate synthase small subunit [Candidatus Competibacteraceae bacterium]